MDYSLFLFFFSSRRRHTRFKCDWSSDVCSSDLFRPEAHVIAGRPARAGADEAIVGARIRGRIRGLDLEQTFERKKNRPVKVVGILEADGSSFASEVGVDCERLRDACGRGG